MLHVVIVDIKPHTCCKQKTASIRKATQMLRMQNDNSTSHHK